jgi:Zn-finger protein
MDKFTEKCIDKRIDILVKEYNFNNRNGKHEIECPCYKTGPCHDIKDLNCFFCYCPGYNTDFLEGACNFGNPQGNGFYFERLGHEVSDEIWDCSDCTWPHKEKNVREYLRKFFKGKLDDEKV